MCIYEGWRNGNPLFAYSLGEQWGPCDGNGPLPDCPDHCICAGELNYTSKYIEDLQQEHTGGEAIPFKGMCFPKCLFVEEP